MLQAIVAFFISQKSCKNMANICYVRGHEPLPDDFEHEVAEYIVDMFPHTAHCEAVAMGIRE